MLTTRNKKDFRPSRINSHKSLHLSTKLNLNIANCCSVPADHLDFNWENVDRVLKEPIVTQQQAKGVRIMMGVSPVSKYLRFTWSMETIQEEFYNRITCHARLTDHLSSNIGYTLRDRIIAKHYGGGKPRDDDGDDGFTEEEDRTVDEQFDAVLPQLAKWFSNRTLNDILEKTIRGPDNRLTMNVDPSGSRSKDCVNPQDSNVDFNYSMRMRSSEIISTIGQVMSGSMQKLTNNVKTIPDSATPQSPNDSKQDIAVSCHDSNVHQYLSESESRRSSPERSSGEKRISQILRESILKQRKGGNNNLLTRGESYYSPNLIRKLTDRFVVMIRKLASTVEVNKEFYEIMLELNREYRVLHRVTKEDFSHMLEVLDQTLAVTTDTRIYMKYRRAVIHFLRRIYFNFQPLGLSPLSSSTKSSVATTSSLVTSSVTSSVARRKAADSRFVNQYTTWRNRDPRTQYRLSVVSAS